MGVLLYKFLIFSEKTIQTNNYSFASWVKDSGNNSAVYIYLEGDGNAFNYAGLPSFNPTPKSYLMREFAFMDARPNVVYLARPCQFIQSENCSVKDWTTGRFSKKIVDDTATAIKKIADGREVVLIGYSGGALLSGLVISNYPEIKVKKWITIAGVLNHHQWTDYFNDKRLVDSIDLDKLPNVSQKHFVAENDKVVPVDLAKKWVDEKDLIIIQNATHNSGWKNLNFD